jgi:hypothetical protein
MPPGFPQLAGRHLDDAKSLITSGRIDRGWYLRRRRHAFSILFVVACAAAAGGCANKAQIFEDRNEGGWFSKPLNLFARPDWASYSEGKRELDNRGPVGPEDLVAADGRCAPPVVQAAPAQPAAAKPAAPAVAEASAAPPQQGPSMATSTVGTMAGDLGGESAPVAPPPPVAAAPPPDRLEPASLGGGDLPAVLGGVALGMTECQVVRRAGQPGNVAIGGGARGERNVTITYLAGTWPGIYHFDGGRLKEIDSVPETQRPTPKAKRVKKKPTRPKTAKGEAVYVQ